MKDTNNLRQELMEAPSLDQFLSENQDSFNRDSICELLNRLFQKRRISKATLAKQSGMSDVLICAVKREAVKAILTADCEDLGVFGFHVSGVCIHRREINSRIDDFIHTHRVLAVRTIGQTCAVCMSVF